jgi:hypothetical protein
MTRDTNIAMTEYLLLIHPGKLIQFDTRNKIVQYRNNGYTQVAVLFVPLF